MHKDVLRFAACAGFVGLALLTPGFADAAWPTDPLVNVPLCTAAGDQLYPAGVPVSGAPGEVASGVVFTWYDQRNGDWDIYAQRISAGGALRWPADGVAICTAGGNQVSPDLIPDGSMPGETGSGAIVTWCDSRSGGNDLYAQRISADGTLQWAASGVPICTASGAQEEPTIGPGRGLGGHRRLERLSRRQLRHPRTAAQHRRKPGRGHPDPRAALAGQRQHRYGRREAHVVGGGSGSGVATVYRSVVSGECAHRRGRGGWHGLPALHGPHRRHDLPRGYRLGIVDGGIEGFCGETWVDLPAREGNVSFALDPVRPNTSQGGALTVRFTLPGAAAASLDLLDVAGRRIATREVGLLGAGRHTLDFGDGGHLAPGLYLVRLRQGPNTRVARAAVIE